MMQVETGCNIVNIVNIVNINICSIKGISIISQTAADTMMRKQ